MEYAVRGVIVQKAQQLQSELAAGQTEGKDYEKIVMCNIGNPQSLGQKPVSFFRQVLSLCDYPEMLDNPAVGTIFPPDVVARATHYMKTINGGTGAYTESKGHPVLRQEI